MVTLADAKPGASLKTAAGWDPTGGLLSAMAIPSTPVFFRIDENGTVKATWLGFDSTKADAFVKDVVGK